MSRLPGGFNAIELSKTCMWLRETKPLLRKRSKSRLPSTKRLFSLRDNGIVLLFVDKQIVSLNSDYVLSALCFLKSII